jgi:hypothetical protein
VQIGDICARREKAINSMWTHKLGAAAAEQKLDIAALRRKLSPSTESATSAVYSRVAERKERVEGTCDWIQRDLLDFLSGDDAILTVTGSSGCGKSMLASWVRERLEKRIGLSSYEAISFTFGRLGTPNSMQLASTDVD